MQHTHPLAYCAGVLDAVGRFRLRWRRDENDRKFISGARVWAVVGREAGEFLAHHVGGTWHKGTWVLAADEQREGLQRVVPMMVAQRDTAMKVYKYRITQPSRHVGWEVNPAVRKLRGQLEDRDDE